MVQDTIVQTFFSNRISNSIELVRDEQNLPGLSIAVVHDRDILWSAGFGYADQEQQITATPETLYGVGSITKLITVTTLLRLRDDGQLHLDQPVEQILPELAQVSSPFADPRPVTFRQILSHTAGLPREAASSLSYWNSAQYPSIDQLLKSLEQTKLIFPPLTQWKYSNLGYALLGHAIERLSGIAYQQYVTQCILRPQGMIHSGFQIDALDQTTLATGYQLATGQAPQYAPRPDYAAFTSAMGLYASVKDLARFITLQFHDGPADEAHPLGVASLREMHTPVFMDATWQSGVVLGWRLERIADEIALTHSGGVFGYTSNITVLPTTHLGVVILTNGFMQDSLWRPAALSRTILEQLAPVAHQITAQSSITTHSQELTRYTGTYTIPGLITMDIIIHNGKLLAGQPDATPAARFALVPELEAHTFRATGGPVNGERVIFQVDEDGSVIQAQAGNFLLIRLS